MSMQLITTAAAKEKIESSPVCIVDIRDENSFISSHIREAINLNQMQLAQFIATTEKSLPVIVYCYHGNSSKMAAQYLYSQGFHEVYSMEGGFEAWRSQYDVVS